VMQPDSVEKRDGEGENLQGENRAFRSCHSLKKTEKKRNTGLAQLRKKKKVLTINGTPNSREKKKDEN